MPTNPPQPPTANDDRPENATDNPKSWIAWKRRAEQAESRLTALREALTALPRYRLRHFRDDDETALSCEMGVERSDVDDGVLIRVEDLRAALSASVPPQSEPHPLVDAVEDVHFVLKDLYNALVLDFATAPEWMVREVGKVARESVDKALNILSVPFKQWCDSQWTDLPKRKAQPEASPATERPRTPDHRDAYDAVMRPEAAATPTPFAALRGLLADRPGDCDGAPAPSSSREVHASTREELLEKLGPMAPVAEALLDRMASSSREVEVCANPADCCRELMRVWKALGITGYTGKSASEHVATLLRHLDAQEAELRALIKEWRESERFMTNSAGWCGVVNAKSGEDYARGRAVSKRECADDLDRLVTRRETK